MAATVFAGTDAGTGVGRLEQGSRGARGGWFAAAVELGAEEPLALELILAVGLETYVPLISQRVRVRGRWRSAERLLHPGYVLMRGQLRRPSVLGKVLLMPGVIDMLRMGEHLVEIPVDQVATVRRLENPRGMIPAEVAAQFKVDQVLQVLAGPFTMFTGPVVEVDVDRTRVALTMLGRTTAVWFDNVDLDKV